MALQDDIKKYYPSFAWAVDNPALKGFLERAVSEAAKGDGEGWDSARFMTELQATDWWKNTEPQVREFQQRIATDPAQNNERLRQREAKLWDRSRNLGLNLSADVVRQQALQAEQFGLADEQIQDALVETAKQRGYQGVQGNLGGISSSIAELRKQASNYFVPIDDNKAFEWATQVANGERDIRDFDALFREQSKARFSHDEQMLQQIDAGFTPSDILQPVTATLSQLMEKPINLNDPKWSQVLDYADPSGKRRVATVSEAAKVARSTAEWKKTANGQEAGSKMLGNIRQMMTGNR